MDFSEAEDMVLNGWKAFSQSLEPWSDDVVFWAFRKSDRKTFLVLHDTRSLARWTRLSGSPLEPGEADYVLPVSANKPPLPDEPVFRNPLPVVVMLVMSNRGLIVIRRALVDGYGMAALPGGFHNQGETWQEAGCRELFEETGVRIDASRVRVYDVVTVRNGSVNLVFGVYDGLVVDPVFVHDSEIMEVFEISSAIDTAFPAHTEVIARYLSEKGAAATDMRVTPR